MSDAPLLRMTGIRKSFLGVEVLHGVDIDVRAGQVHALVGENGAGKSTLMKILAGVYAPDSGRVVLDGRELTFGHPVQAQNAGVATVFQEFTLLPERTVAENVFLGRERRRWGLIDEAGMNRRVHALAEEIGVAGMDPRARVGSLPVARQQLVEILKALAFDARIISLDEPTAALSRTEVEVLYEVVERLRARGVGVLYVSHRLEEIFDLSQQITVLKDGGLVQSCPTTAITPSELVNAMVGRTMESYVPQRDDAAVMGDVRLAIHGGGNEYVDGIDVSVRAGEIVGLGGLQGSGRTEIAHAVFGVEPFTRGTMTLDGRTVHVRSVRQAVRAGLALVTEDRKSEGLALRQSVLANGRLVTDAVNPRASRSVARAIPVMLKALAFAGRGTGQQVRYLSGGNQQKVVLTKWLVTEPRVVVFDEPTRGIDVGARRAVYELMRDLSAKGVAVLMISSDLPELLQMSDRIVVLRDGRVAGELPGGIDERAVMAMATGTAATGTAATGTVA